MPRRPQPDEGGRNHISDDVRRAAFDLCAAVRRLDELTQDRAWKAALLAGPTRADLTDAYNRLHTLLQHTEEESA
jgi:hypothetical protein